MSSTYRVLCLSHDPGLELDPDFGSPHDAIAAAVDGRPGIEHKGCDLVVGRVSGALTELCCPPTHGQHSVPIWVEIDWLRLLGVLIQTTNPKPPPVAEALSRLTRCWTADRLHRLRLQLGFQGRPT